jgi:hypothetical protein
MIEKLKINLKYSNEQPIDECRVIVYDESKVKKVLTKVTDLYSIQDGRVKIELDVDLSYNIGRVIAWFLHPDKKWSHVGANPDFLIDDEDEKIVALISDDPADKLGSIGNYANNNTNLIPASKAEIDKNLTEFASEETFKQRMEICEKCEFWNSSGFGGTGKCEKCGCSSQGRLRMAETKCPLDPPKW